MNATRPRENLSAQTASRTHHVRDARAKQLLLPVIPVAGDFRRKLDCLELRRGPRHGRSSLCDSGYKLSDRTLAGTESRRKYLHESDRISTNLVESRPGITRRSGLCG